MKLQVFLMALVSLQLSSAQQECLGISYFTDDVLEQKIQTALEADEEECREEIYAAVQDVVDTMINPLLPPLGTHSYNPAASCKEIEATRPSGYYFLKDSTGNLFGAYCDMERTLCGVTGGWMRVENIDMRNPAYSCPSGLNTLHESSKTVCSMNIDGPGCSSVTIATHGVQYSHVCGKIIGYQQKSPDAFLPYNLNPSLTIDDGYVDGISLTHGQSPRQHIWTFAVALNEIIIIGAQKHICPCTNTNNTVPILIPSFVGNDYFCETGSSEKWTYTFYADDPLWDGQGCGEYSTCCTFNNPPWFSKQLTPPTTDDIEMRLCADYGRSDEDITFEQVELYVQ